MTTKETMLGSNIRFESNHLPLNSYHDLPNGFGQRSMYTSSSWLTVLKTEMKRTNIHRKAKKYSRHFYISLIILVGELKSRLGRAFELRLRIMDGR